MTSLEGQAGGGGWSSEKSLAIASENAGELTCGLTAEPFISQSLSSSLKFISVSAITQ